MDEKLKKIYDGVINGRQNAVTEGVQTALDAGIDPGVILNESMIAAMAEVGRLFQEGEYYVPEMLIAARAMKAGLALLRPKLADANVQAIGKVVIGTVQGDLHDIGKNLVGMMLEGAGFEVIDLGVDVSPQKFVDAVKTHQPNFIGLSALLTTTMPMMKATIDALAAADVRGKTKVMIGGAPITQQYATSIGADLFTPDASLAAKRAKEALNA
jgi:5-methyltetrahydrofolate--homocysteine methyltransferase